nr:hypothetical protein [Tanacetum cinerariifolium]
EISRFTQRFEKTFSEAWDRFKELLRACPHHGFSKLTQRDIFYNGLTEQDQDSLNAASGGNLLNKTTREALKIIENKSKVRYSRSQSNVSRVNTNSRDVVSKTDDRIDKLADQISNLVEIINKQAIAPAKVVEKTCGGAHAYYECIATDSNPFSVCAATGSYNQVSPPNRGNNFKGNNFQNNQGYRTPMNNASNFQNQPFLVPNNQIPPSVPNELSSYMKSNEIMIKSMQNQINVLRGDCNKQEENLRKNLNDDMRSILGSFFQNQPSTSAKVPLNENCSAMLLKKLPYSELTPTRMTLKLADRSITRPKGVAEDIFVKVGKFHFPTDFVVVDFEADPRVPLILGRVDVMDIACEDFGQDVLEFQYNPKNRNLTLVFDDLISESDSSKEPIIKSSSPTLTPFGESDFFLEEIKDFLYDDLIPIGIENSVYDPKGGILFLENC